MHDLRYHLPFPGTLATCFSFRNVSFPFLSSPSYAVFHSEAKFYIVGYEFYISERAPSKMFLFQRPASLWQLGQTGRHSPLWMLSWTDPWRSPNQPFVSQLWKLRPGALSTALSHGQSQLLTLASSQKHTPVCQVSHLQTETIQAGVRRTFLLTVSSSQFIRLIPPSYWDARTH